MNEDKVIWQSKLFPEMQLTAKHLSVLKYAYPQINRFEPELRKYEAWLFSNPERVPKKNWRKGITNWMRIASEMQIDKQSRRKPEQGDAARATPGDAKIIGEILRKAME